MHEPRIKESWGKSLCRRTVRVCESWFVKHIARPILFLFPPILVTTLAVRQGLHADVVEFAGESVGNFLNSSALIIIVGTYVYVVLMKAAYAAIRSYAKPARQLETGDLFALLKAIDIVVGDKTKRFNSEAKLRMKAADVCGRKTFLQITRPDQQIPLLIAGIRSVFEFMGSKNTAFRVGLIKIENDKPVDWYSFDPASSPPRTPAADLKAPTSTVSRCIKARSIVVVENIGKELAKKTKGVVSNSKCNTQFNECLTARLGYV
ncbi:hypothetical protein [Marinobacter salexigens]|uniref:Uncharacterized protein n=1 Tax=Marinobacter salexigens TaxID=1925763 RepID=A0ABS6AAG3_9GAMM|nr:hypothetical protein [Marinobacter salexigens]MBU2874162.1 hypothetical protein [Marinobacter salexigens]